VASLFTKIIEGDLPGHFVWKDPVCVAFLSIGPLKPGHTLVVPRVEVDHWLDLDPETVAHLARVSQNVGRALFRAYHPVKVGTLTAGLEVPHVHFHVVPIWEPRDLDFGNVDPESLAAEAEKVRQALRELGYDQVSN
jgi:histidine triad (HIT) family protein